MANEDTSLIARLFVQEIPEIAAGSITIKAIARKPGYRSKLALQSQDPSIDCIAVCVGPGGLRIRNIIDALGGEQMDLFRWDDSPERLIVNSLQPAVIENVILYPAEHRAVVVADAEQVSHVLGRGGWNRELASRICDWRIEVQESQSE
jgi:N utilization substance protein A